MVVRMSINLNMVLVKTVRDGILFEMDSDEEEEKDDEQTDGREENDRD